MEAPHLSQLAEKHQAAGLTVLAVNAWDEERDIVNKFVRDNNLKQRVVMDGKQVFKEAYGLKSVPTVFWIDRSGKIVRTHLDYDAAHADVLDKYTASLVNGKG